MNREVTVTFFLMMCMLLCNFLAARDTLSLIDFHNIVLDNHPLIKQANLNNDIAEAYRLKGLGTLDPKLNSSFDAKQFTGTNYFRKWNSEVKLPTRYPIDLSAGYEQNSGNFLNEESVLPNNGLVYGTVNVSLLRGLLFDEQRYNLKMADIMGVKSQLDREIMIREVLVAATQVYIDWAATYELLQTQENFLDLISIRHQNIIELFNNGDKPAIDTIESRVNLNTATKLYFSYQAKLIEKTQKLSLFLWDKDSAPLNINSDVYPEQLVKLVATIRLISNLTNPIFDNELKINKLNNSIEQIELENRLIREQLKPRLDLKYNSIFNLGNTDLDLTYNINDYKLGASLEIPLRNRKTRGELGLNNAIIEQIALDRTFQLSKMNLEYERIVTTIDLLDQTLDILNEKVTNSTTLYQAEQLKFQLGESSIFLLNQRERKLLEAQNEIIKSYLDLGIILSELYFMRLGIQQ